MGSVGYTQVSPMKVNQFVNQKKKFFANNQHHKQSEFVFGSPVIQRGGYGNEAVQNQNANNANAAPQVETVKKSESHPIEQYWNEYKRQREAAAIASNEVAPVGYAPQANSAAPQSGVHDGANFHGR